MITYARPNLTLERLELIISVLGEKLDKSLESKDGLELLETYEYLVEYAAGIKGKLAAKAMLRDKRIERILDIKPPVPGVEE